MKRLSLLSFALIAVLFESCIVKSLYPFYKEEDLVFRKELVNTWTDQEGHQWEIKPVKEKPNAYEMHWRQRGDEDVVFLAHLFKLDDALYFDFLPLSNGQSDDGGLTIFNLHLMPTHSIAKVDILNSGEVQIKWFNEEWLRSLFQQNRIRIKHEVIYDEFPKDDDDKTYVLTASTDELQKFVMKYSGEEAAFDNGNTVWLRLKKAN